MKNPSLPALLLKNVAERFPFVPRVKRSFWGLLAFCLMAIIFNVGDTHGLRIGVQPIDSLSAAGYVVPKKGGNIVPGYLLIANPTFTQRLLLHDNFSDIDLFTLIIMALVSILIIIIMNKFKDERFFKNDVSVLIRLTGGIIIVHGLVGVYRNSYEDQIVHQLTQDAFESIHHFPVLLWAELYLGFLVIAIATWYRKGVQLQQEQDLTV